MKRNSLFVVLISAVFALSACSNQYAADSGSSSATVDHNAADVTFTREMITHHRGAIAMAQLVLAGDAPPEIKGLADRVHAEQEAEIATMSEWLRSWGETVPTALPSSDSHATGHPSEAAGEETQDPMEALRTQSGTQLAETFLNEMVIHHNEAITAATEQTAMGQYPPAQELASRIAQSQQAEIAEMTEMLADLDRGTTGY